MGWNMMRKWLREREIEEFVSEKGRDSLNKLQNVEGSECDADGDDDDVDVGSVSKEWRKKVRMISCHPLKTANVTRAWESNLYLSFLPHIILNPISSSTSHSRFQSVSLPLTTRHCAHFTPCLSLSLFWVPSLAPLTPPSDHFLSLSFHFIISTSLQGWSFHFIFFASSFTANL